MGYFSEIIAAFEGKFRYFRKKEPIHNLDGFFNFLTTRASFVTQKTLYGYLKTRMGTKYVEGFEDELFVESINIAKWNIYADCLSDLAVYMTANTCNQQEKKISKKQKNAIAKQWYQTAIKEKFENGDFSGDVSDIRKRFDTKLVGVNWDTAHEGENAFTASPAGLVKWSPIADELKTLDEPIVRNSIRFQWGLIRDEFHNLVDYQQLNADWAEFVTKVQKS